MNWSNGPSPLAYVCLAVLGLVWLYAAAKMITLAILRGRDRWRREQHERDEEQGE